MPDWLLCIPNRHTRRASARRAVSGLLSAILTLGAMTHAQDEPPIGGDLVHRESVHVSLPEAHPARIEGFDDDAAYLQTVRARADELLQRAEAEAGETTRVELLLAVANHILAWELEPACTRQFLELSSVASPNAEAATALARAEQALRLSDEFLTRLRGRDATDPAWLSAVDHAYRTLTAFAQALNEYLAPPGESGDSLRTREAASAIAVLMEDDDAGVAAAATLWHAVLRTRAGEPQAALAVLPASVTDAARSAMPHAFFAHLLRCELRAREGGYGAALALLAKMDEPAGAWFPAGAPRDDAMRTLAWTKLRVLRSWHEELRKTDERSAEASWCLERVQAIAADRLPEGRRTVSRISPVIPVIAAVSGSEHTSKPPTGE